MLAEFGETDEFSREIAGLANGCSFFALVWLILSKNCCKNGGKPFGFLASGFEPADGGNGGIMPLNGLLPAVIARIIFKNSASFILGGIGGNDLGDSSGFAALFIGSVPVLVKRGDKGDGATPVLELLAELVASGGRFRGK